MTLVVGVVPAHERTARPRLCAALEAAYDVRLVGGAPAHAAAVIAFGPAGRAAVDHAPALLAMSEERPAGARRRGVRLADDPGLDRTLRGARLTDAHAAVLAGVQLHVGDAVLARVGDAPAWVRRAGSEVEVAASFPAELGPDEALRDRLAPGRCLALLPLVHLLARLRAPAEPPVTRAAFVLDDPNLHWPRYGPVDYAVLAGHALVHDYHVAMAMVPLDGWLAHPRAVHVFRTSPQRLSVAIHGNDHAGPELGRVRDAASAARIAAQALRRMTAFERRTGIAVSRVMVPPHEELSEPAVAGLLRCGYDAVCTTRPYPWLAAVGRHWLTRPPGADVLAGWWAAPRIGDGLPLLLRHGFDHAREDLVLRAFLGQPLIVYGHPGDLADGLEPLAETAAAINRLGDVRWGSLGELARASRGADAGPDDARPPAVAPVGPYPQPPLPPSPPPRLWPVARRLAGESRDRLRAGRPRKRRPPSLVHRS